MDVQKIPARLPRYDELPAIPLYMDQVVTVIGEAIAPFISADVSKAVTSHIINNYVKLGIIPSPDHKKYGREQIARLIVLCILKQILPISSIQILMDHREPDVAFSVFYDDFCVIQEKESAAASALLLDKDEQNITALRLAVRAGTVKTQAETLISSYAKEKKEES